MIKEIITGNQLHDSVNVIRGSFKTVAEELHLTPDNAPSHPSFITYEKLLDIKNRGLKLYGLYSGYTQIGFVAMERADGDVFYMEKLCVLPEYRHCSHGKELVNYIFDQAKKQGCKKVGIGIINEQIVLKSWYEGLGFKETGIKKFDHLPFTVCFMERMK